MSLEFIKESKYSTEIAEAAEQEKQLSYFCTSKIQDSRLDDKYFQNWAERKYQTNDYFLNWIKSIFKTENFLLFSKYLRYPLPSAKLINNKIEPQLYRVFNAEDSDFKYEVGNKETSEFIEDLDIKRFNNDIFTRILYHHNSIIISDLDSIIPNKPHRYFVDISDVVSIDFKGDKITKIAFKSCINDIKGVVYIDDNKYEFYQDDNLILESYHDLKSCPAHFIVNKSFGDSKIVKESIFTYVREELEEYTFLKTLQRMTEPNGAIPIVTKIEVDSESDLPNEDGQPNADNIMGSQMQGIYNENKNISSGDLQPGTIHEVHISSLQGADGNINTDPVVNYLNFHYLPIESLKYLNDRINELKSSIVATIVGDSVSGSDQAQNELQTEKNISILENTLFSLAETLNRIRSLSDKDMLSLKYGTKMVKDVFIHYGTDFFLDSRTKLYEDLEKAPNSLERKNLIIRINQNRYKNNQTQYVRQKLLYDVMPYVSDKDFEFALSQQIVTPENKALQTKFTYYIGRFESQYGDIVSFYNGLDIDKSQKIILINNLVMEIVKKDLPQQEP